MKKNDCILITTVALYSFLFYQESAGINFVLFNLALISALLIKDQHVLKSKGWLLTASGSLLSALCVGYYGNGLSVTANIISLSLLSALSYGKGTSVILSLLFSIYSYVSSFILVCIERQQKNAEKEERKVKKWGLIIIPILITLIFFFMYRSSNALFNDFTKNISFDFISFGWILFTFSGVVLLTGFFYHQRIKTLALLDESASNAIDPSNSKTIALFGKELSITDEEFSGKLLFLLLNLLLLVVNALDVQFMFIDNKLPKGVTYSEFVHQGTGMLITSILMAIAIILFYFRGALNFSEKGNIIKWMAYVWIIQNAFMICSTLFRNNMYVAEYGLTYKRIGVYVYLILTLIGLITTYIKIAKIKSNFFLFRVNGWAFYTVLVIAAFVNWDRFISEFNINKARQVQTEYLVDLSYTVLPTLYAYHIDSLGSEEQMKHSVLTSGINTFERIRDEQLFLFLKRNETQGWKSWYLDGSKTHEELISMHDHQRISALNLSFMKIASMKPLNEFKGIHSLNLIGNAIKDSKELSDFNELTALSLQKNGLVELKGLRSMKKLEVLDIRHNRITDYSPLFELKNLKKLYVDTEIPTTQFEALQQQLPQTTIIKS